MARRSLTSPAPALALALGWLVAGAACAPYTVVANVVSHVVVHEADAALPPAPQHSVRCSAQRGLLCRTLVQGNRLLINVFHDEYGGESDQNTEETLDVHTVKSIFGWKPDRISKSNNDPEHEHKTASTNTWDDISDTQDSLGHISHKENGADVLEEDDVDFQVSNYDSNLVDDSTSEINQNFEDSKEEVTTQFSELENGEKESKDNGLKNDYEEILYENNARDGDSKHRENEESESSPDNAQYNENNGGENSFQDSEENFDIGDDGEMSEDAPDNAQYEENNGDENSFQDSEKSVDNDGENTGDADNIEEQTSKPGTFRNFW